MATQNVKLPDVGEGVTEGELVRWFRLRYAERACQS